MTESKQAAEIDARGLNPQGVAMCLCKNYGGPHAWEPGESCNPTRRVPTPCGARVCTGCATCVKAWAAGKGIDLTPWQVALVERVYSTGEAEVNQ